MDEPTKEKGELALEPRVVMAAMHTTTMRASITAYSTAVGPSSAFRNDTRFLVRPRIGNSTGEKVRAGGGSPRRRYPPVARDAGAGDRGNRFRAQERGP